MTRKPEIEIETTAAELANALWGHLPSYHGIEDLSLGCYEGTKIPVRKVPADAPVVLKVGRGWTLIEDRDGGWIADRFGPTLGYSWGKRAAAVLLKG